MKKYQQLLLAILTIFSFFSLLIYRHEYNKLRYVLEVLNFFGVPGASTPVPNVCANNITLRRLQLSENPSPAWQRVSNSLYIYSAYWEKIDNKEHVKAFAIGVLNENLNYGCHLWFDSYTKKKTGQFSFSGIPYKPQDVNKGFGKSKTKAFVFYCETDSKDLAPVGVTFYKSSVNESSQGFLPVASLPTGPPRPNSTGICILPTPFPSYNKSTYLEFLSFHQIIGVNDFIVYGANDQYGLLSLIHRDISNKIDLSILQWNYPFYGDVELMRVIAENDCRTRASGLFESVAILDWNKLLVPRYLFPLSKIFSEFDHDKKTYKFQLSTLLYCMEYEDDVKSNISFPLILKKTKYSLPKVDTPVVIYRPHMKLGKIQKVSKGIIAVHQYSSCRDIKIKSGDKKSDKLDDTMYNFKESLLKSKFLNYV